MSQRKEYHLLRYRGTASKTRCPHCGEKTFKPYVDENETPFSADYVGTKFYDQALTVGRCDNERKCGWHYTPGQFRKERGAKHIVHNEGWKPPPPPEVAAPLPFEYVTRSMLPYHSVFGQFLRETFKGREKELDEVMKMYYVGATRDRRIAYWYIDVNGNLKDGKFMAYKPDGHRDHDINPYFARKSMILKRCYGAERERLLSMDVIKPYFGEHLLADPKNAHKPVVVVEGEKSALIGSIMNDQFIWLACGGVGLSPVKLITAMKQKRMIIIVPDVDQIENWRKKHAELNYPKAVYAESFILAQKESPKDDVGDILLRMYIRGSTLTDAVHGKGGTDPTKTPKRGENAVHGDRAKLGTIKADAPGASEQNSPQAQLADTSIQAVTTEESVKPQSRIDRLREMVTEVQCIESALGGRCDALRTLYLGLDLELWGEETYDPSYEGF